MTKHRCQRRDEMFGSGDRFPGPDTWRDDDTCSYCGSLNPDVFMAHLEAGDIEVGTTDKNYKVYVHGLPNPNAGNLCIRSSVSGGKDTDEIPHGYVRPKDITDPEQLRVFNEWQKSNGGECLRAVRFTPDVPERFAKFYFQHLNEAQMTRFIELFNEKKLKYGRGFGFYVLPYFMRLGPKDELEGCSKE